MVDDGDLLRLAEAAEKATFSASKEMAKNVSETRRGLAASDMVKAWYHAALAVKTLQAARATEPKEG